MTATVVAIPISPISEDAGRNANDDQRVHIVVHIQAEVLDVEVARRMANAWLLQNAGNLHGATKPELLVDDGLFWRFEIILGLPNRAQPGSGAMYRVGQIVLDAATGEVQDAEALAEELRASASAIEH